jgi:lipopolysaccharide export system protein LptC
MTIEPANAVTDRAGPRDAAAAPAPRVRRKLRTAHTRIVGWLKFVLPAIALGIMTLLAVWSQDKKPDKGFRLGTSSLKLEDVAGQRLVNARYTGIDGRDRPFTVTAESLDQADKEADVVDLKEPKADVALSESSWAALSAPRGRYSRKERILRLAGGVSLFHDGGYEFHTARAEIDMGNNAARGDDPVDGHGPFGTLQSSGFRIESGGERIYFTGRAKLVVHPGAKGSAK